MNHSDLPGGTVIIEPDFPLSPLQCSVPAVSVNSDSHAVFTSPTIHSAGSHAVFTSPTIHSAGRLCSAAEMLTVTAAHSRPTTTIVNCTEAHLVSSQLSCVTFPSAVYDKVRNLFCTSDSETNQNRLSDTLSSDTGQQNRQDDELVTEPNEIVCTTAASSVGSSTPLESSYVDAGRIPYTQSDVNVLAKVSAVTTADVPVMTSCINSSTSELHIANVYSLCNNVDMTTSPEVLQSLQSPSQRNYVKSSFSPSSTKHALQDIPNTFTKKSPTSGFKRKRSWHKEKNHESDVLFKENEKAKHAGKKRRLYKHDMLMEDQPQHLNSGDNVDKHFHREKSDVACFEVRSDNRPECETVISGHENLPTTLVSATVPVTSSLTANCSETSNNQAVDSINNAISSSSQNSVEITGVEFDVTQSAFSTETDLHTGRVASLGSSMPVVIVNKLSNILLEKELIGVKHRGVMAGENNQGIEMDRDVAVVVSTSSVSPRPPVPSTVSQSVTSVSILNPAVHVVSAEWPRSLNYTRNNPHNSKSLTGDKRPNDCVTDKLLNSSEHRTDNAAVRNLESEVSDKDLPEMHREDSAALKHAVGSDTIPEVLSVVASGSYHSSVVRPDNSLLVHSSSLYPSNDNSQRNVPETSKVPVCMSSMSSIRDGRTDIADDTNIPHHPRPRSTSLKEVRCQSSSGSTDLKSVSFDNTSDVNETTTVKDRDISRNKKRTLSRKKLQRRTSITSQARTSSTDHNKNVVTISGDIVDHHRLSTQTENTSSAAELCIPSQNTNESSSQSLLCAQKQSAGSYCLRNLTVSLCQFSAVGTPLLPSHSCSLHCRGRECCRVAEESLGYVPPKTKAGDIELSIGGDRKQLMHSEKCFPTNLIANVQLNTPNAHGEDRANRVLPAVSDMSDVCTSADAAVISGTETESKPSSNGSGKLTLPTPKNSLTSYQPANNSSSPAPVTESSLVSAASQPNYDVIQVLIFDSF